MSAKSTGNTSLTSLVLIVDDDPVISRPLANGLKGAGYEVIQAATGADALALGNERQPQLVLLDYQLPDINGLEVLTRLRRDPGSDWGKNVPVIFATNIYDVDTMNTAMELGVRDYVLKSDINLEGIIKLVANYVPLQQVP